MAVTHSNDAASAVIQSTPSAVAVGAHLAGITPERWLTYCGMAFIALQAAYLVWKWYREWRAK